MTSDELRLAERAAVLERSARAQGYSVSGDGYVNAACAAMLIGKSVYTLRNWRYAGSSLPFRRLGGRRGHAQYSLRVLAQYCLDAEDESTESTEAYRSVLDAPSAAGEAPQQPKPPPLLKAAS